MTGPDLRRLAPPAGTRIAIAGGCGGIGRPLVRACLDNDLRVAVLDLPASLERHPPPAGVQPVPLDATDPARVDAAFAALGAWHGLDVLVSLVGFTLTPPVSLLEATPAQWDEVQAGNLRAAWLLARAAAPLLHQAGGGCIVNTASMLAINPLPGFGPYAAAKAGLVALTKGLAHELAPRIRVNAVAPSAVHTAFMGGGTGRGGDEGGDDWFAAGQAYAQIPLGRLAEPEDVVGPILFLASDAARFITGQVLGVNGGRG